MPEDSAEKCNAHVICRFNNSLLGTWHLSSKTLFRVPSQKKFFPNYIVKKVNAQLPQNTENVSTMNSKLNHEPRKMLLLIFLSKVELLLIKAHFSYARAAHGMFCPMSYAQITFL